MNVLIWRLHRNQVYWAVGAFVALTVLLLITGITMSSEYHSFFASCEATQSCNEAGSLLFRGDGAIIDIVNATLIVPLLLGLFWAAPLVAQEFEENTQSLVWTQGVTRRHWLTANVLWVFLASIVWVGALTLLVSWWRTPENALGTRFDAFDIQGLVPIAYAIFAVSLGLAVGSAIRRVLPAIAVTLGVFVAIRLLVAVYIRPHFMTPVTKLFPFPFSDQGAPKGAWILSSSLVGPHGHQFGDRLSLSIIPRVCQGVGRKGVSLQCMVSHGFRETMTYQPANRFWTFQGIESALYVFLALGMVLIAYGAVLRRDA